MLVSICSQLPHPVFTFFFQLKPIVLCCVHDGFDEPAGLFPFTVVPGDILFAFSLLYMKLIQFIQLSYFLAFFSCLVLNSPVAPHLSSATSLSCCSNGSSPMLRREAGLSHIPYRCWCCCLSYIPRKCSSSSSSRILLQMLQPMIPPMQLPSNHL